jgi:tRNA 2-thiouridine synthesizing protein D
MANLTVVITEAPYGRERAYTALRFALTALVEGHHIRLFLVQDGVFVAKKSQDPSEFPNHLEYLSQAVEEGAEVVVCTPCARARGLSEEDLLHDVRLGTMHDLVQWSVESDQVLTF